MEANKVYLEASDLTYSQFVTRFFYVKKKLLDMCRNLPFGGRATRDSLVHLPRKEYARSRHQRLFEENVRKTRKDVVYEL